MKSTLRTTLKHTFLQHGTSFFNKMSHRGMIIYGDPDSYRYHLTRKINMSLPNH